jgi:spore coat protein U-like protein
MRGWLAVACRAGHAVGARLAATGSTFTVSGADRRRLPGGGGVTTYGVLDYGTSSAVHGHLSTSLGGTTVTFQCTPGRGHEHEPGRRPEQCQRHRNLKRTGGTPVLAYQLYRDAAYSQSLGIGQSVTVSYSDPTAIKLPVYGRVQLTGTLPAGTYTDVVQVTVTW